MGVRTLSQVIEQKRIERETSPEPSELACRMAESNAADYGIVQTPEWWDEYIAFEFDLRAHGKDL